MGSLTRKLLLLAVVALGTVWLALRSGTLPLPGLDLARPGGWLLDWQLARLSSDRAQCRATLAEPWITATAVPDRPTDAKGCGWHNAVSVTAVGRVDFRGSPMTCPVAAAFALWVRHVVQPAAERHLGGPVVAISGFGTYSCRSIVGGLMGKYGAYVRKVDASLTLSEHARANAVDISAFRLAGGGTVSVLADWPASGPKAAFLREVHDGACRYFRVTLGPEANREHANHFHLDRGLFSACR